MAIQLGGVPAVVVFSDAPQQLAEWYTKAFGLRALLSTDSFVALGGAGAGLFIQRTSEGHRPGMGGVRPHFLVEDCRAALAELLRAGAAVVLPVSDTGGELVAAIRDPEGNPLGLLQRK